MFEGGIRVPTIAAWPGRIPAGVEHAELGMMMDVLPTVLHAADGRSPDLPDIDGISYLEALKAAGSEGASAAGRKGASAAGDSASGVPRAGERTVVWSYQDQWAVRRGRHKLVIDAREGMDPPAAVQRALYDLEADPAETTDLTDQLPQVLAELERELPAAR